MTKHQSTSGALSYSYIVLAIMLVFAWLHPAAAQPLLNQLKNSPSPYLALHGEDPVAWQEWSPTTMELARRQNKLLFVSIGYFSCHWCHVMQGESYRNAEIAALINHYFIPVKVDRELEVALDAEMIAYAQNSLGSAGWPLNVFITPEGYPLHAVLYEKPERFNAVLSALGKEWQRDSAGLRAIAQKAVTKELPIKKIKPSAALAEKYRKQLVQETLEQADLLSGGINTPRKFPLSPQLVALLEIEERHHDAKLAEWLRLTLDQMARGGLRDHVGGGFFRYTVDPAWHTPHFEKMLYDNTQLAVIYLRAARIFNHPAYRDIALETLDFMLNEMRAGAAFVSSTSALDEQGREGGVYLWNEAQLRAIIAPEEYALLARLWGMDTAAESDLGYLPMNSNEPAAGEQKRLKEIYRKLLHARKDRALPRDTKLLAGLNGLALAAFSEAADLAPRFRQAADELHTFILESLWQNGTLHKGMSGQQLLGSGDLESYAYTVAGLMRYAQLSGKVSDKKIVEQIAKTSWKKFHTTKGFVLQERSELAKPYYQGVVADSPLPSPSSILIQISLRTGDAALRGKAINALADGEALQRQGVFWYASQVTALNQLLKP
ncbi:MAG TPA: DUF255 domain-containing protein [Gallionellaceae bacterium]|nr:DUF255 domain-containing protein [Gallionellaceae bacterium]